MAAIQRSPQGSFRYFLAAIVFLFVSADLVRAGSLPEGRLPLLDATTRLMDLSAVMDTRDGAVAFRHLTMEYRFGQLLGEPLMAFRGRYSFGDAAVIKATEACWEYLNGNPEEGLRALERPLVRVSKTERFAAAFKEISFLSSSLFSVDIVPSGALAIGANRSQLEGMHLRFRPDSLAKAPADFGPSVSGSPSWGALLRRADGSFHDEATAKRVFAAGFEVANLQLLEPSYNVNALSRELEAICREGLARLAAANKPEETALAPKSAAALENALESAFGGGAAEPPQVEPEREPTPPPAANAGETSVATALELAAQRKAQREKIAALRQRSQQFLGHVETQASSVLIYARDHGSEDGDRVTILLNGAEEETIELAHAVRRIALPLVPGDNVIEIRALNQGSSGKNTALFWVETEGGQEIARKEWNLSTGGNATLLVIRI